MTARIYKPAKTAMSSGKAKTQKWVLDYAPDSARRIEPLMGYTSSADMASQIRMTFDSRQDAIDYAKRHKIAYQVMEPETMRRRPMAYSDNFRFDRRQPWTH